MSEFKKNYESPFIGRMVAKNISSLLGDEELAGKHALVIGFGDIGQAVATALLQILGMRVGIHDKDPIKLVKIWHHLPQFNVYGLLHEAISGKDLIIGAVGSRSIGTEDRVEETGLLSHLNQNVILVSSSSSDREITLQGLHRHLGDKGRIEEWKVRKKIAGRKYKLSRIDPIRDIRVLADGLPVNFYNADSISAEAIDPILTLIFLCACRLVRNKYEPEVLDADKVVLEEKLAQRVLTRHLSAPPVILTDEK